eukprot:jgi/Chrzof1/11785/Cz06g10020.t1
MALYAQSLATFRTQVLRASLPGGVLRQVAFTSPQHSQGIRPRSASRLVCSAGSALVDRIKGDMKDAMKAKDQFRLDTIRFLNAAIKQREIELRESSSDLTDAEIIKVLQKLAKQRKDSIDSYKAGGRQDLVDKEEAELKVMVSYLPTQLSAEEVQKAVEQAVAETGATSVKQMGAVMKVVMTKTQGQADNKLVSDLVKAALSK